MKKSVTDPRQIRREIAEGGFFYLGDLNEVAIQVALALGREGRGFFFWRRAGKNGVCFVALRAQDSPYDEAEYGPQHGNFRTPGEAFDHGVSMYPEWKAHRLEALGGHDI